MKTLKFSFLPLATIVAALSWTGCKADSSSSSSGSLSSSDMTPSILERAGVSPSDELAPVGEHAQESQAETGLFDLMPDVPTDMPPDVTEIVKLAHAGISEDIQLAFVAASAIARPLTADEIVYLTDVGVSPEVIAARIQRTTDNSADIPQPSDSQPVLEEAPATLDPAASAETTLSTTPEIIGSNDSEPSPDFYEALSPYGHWINVDGYGMCWKPSVAVVDRQWQPYRDRGRWLHSDLGWYWQSDYQWGWAAFHYGRWFSDPAYGWCWYPDTVWAPSWVTWRTYDSYCGWAPLPPRSYYRPGVGFIYWDRPVGFSFGFGLSYSNYSWCSYRNLCHPQVYRYCEPVSRHRSYYRHSTVVNSYGYGSNNVIINNGIHIDRVNAARGTHVKRVAVRHQVLDQDGESIPDRVVTRGDDSYVVAQRIAERPSNRTTTQTATSEREGANLVNTPRTIESPSTSRISTKPAPSVYRGTTSHRTTVEAPSSTPRSIVTSLPSVSSAQDRQPTPTKSIPSRYESQPKAKQIQTRSETRVISSPSQSRTTVNTPNGRLAEHPRSTSSYNRIERPGPVIISPSGPSPNSRFPKPNIIGNSRSQVSSPTPIPSRPSSIRTPSSSIQNSTPGSRSFSPSQNSSSFQPESISRSSPLLKRNSSRPSSGSINSATPTRQPSQRPPSRPSSSGSAQQRNVQSRPR